MASRILGLLDSFITPDSAMSSAGIHVARSSRIMSFLSVTVVNLGILDRLSHGPPGLGCQAHSQSPAVVDLDAQVADAMAAGCQRLLAVTVKAFTARESSSDHQAPVHP